MSLTFYSPALCSPFRLEAATLRGCFRGATGRLGQRRQRLSIRMNYRRRQSLQHQLPVYLVVGCLLAALLSWLGAGFLLKSDTVNQTLVSATQIKRPAILSWEHHAQQLASLANPKALNRSTTQLVTAPRPVFRPKPATPKLAPKPLTALVNPVPMAQMTSPFGLRWGRVHQGVDYAAPVGTRIRSAQAGVVTYAGWQQGYGQLVIVRHGPGLETRYAHCSRLKVRVGHRVAQGQTIALVGNTGHSTGPHLHFEVWKNGLAHNPVKFVRNETMIVSHGNRSHQG